MISLAISRRRSSKSDVTRLSCVVGDHGLVIRGNEAIEVDDDWQRESDAKSSVSRWGGDKAELNE